MILMSFILMRFRAGCFWRIREKQEASRHNGAVGLGGCKNKVIDRRASEDRNKKSRRLECRLDLEF